VYFCHPSALYFITSLVTASPSRFVLRKRLSLNLWQSHPFGKHLVSFECSCFRRSLHRCKSGLKHLPLFPLLTKERVRVRSIKIAHISGDKGLCFVMHWVWGRPKYRSISNLLILRFKFKVSFSKIISLHKILFIKIHSSSAHQLICVGVILTIFFTFIFQNVSRLATQ
jgi:hypothetical protein